MTRSISRRGRGTQNEQSREGERDRKGANQIIPYRNLFDLSNIYFRHKLQDATKYITTIIFIIKNLWAKTLLLRRDGKKASEGKKKYPSIKSAACGLHPYWPRLPDHRGFSASTSSVSVACLLAIQLLKSARRGVGIVSAAGLSVS